ERGARRVGGGRGHGGRPLAGAPVNDDGVRVLGAVVVERPAQHVGAVLVDRAVRGQARDNGRHVVDGDRGARGAGRAVIIGHGHGDRVGVGGGAGRVVVEVLVRGGETAHARAQAEGGRALARTPGDDDRVRVRRLGVAERAAQRGRAVLVDRRGRR